MVGVDQLLDTVGLNRGAPHPCLVLHWVLADALFYSEVLLLGYTAGFSVGSNTRSVTRSVIHPFP